MIRNLEAAAMLLDARAVTELKNPYSRAPEIAEVNVMVMNEVAGYFLGH